MSSEQNVNEPAATGPHATLDPIFVTLEPVSTSTTSRQSAFAQSNGGLDDDDSCFLCLNISGIDLTTGLVNAAALASVVIAGVSGAGASFCPAVVAALSHGAMTAKLDVFNVRSPDYVAVNDGFSIFNLQGLLVPWEQNETTTNTDRRRLLEIVHSNSTTVASNSTLVSCYDTKSSTVQDVRTLQKLANVRNVAAKFSQVESNLFYVLVFFLAAMLLQLMFFVILRAVVRCRVADYQRKMKRLRNFAKSVRNANRLRQFDGNGQKPTSSNGDAADGARVSRGCKYWCRRSSLRVTASLFGLVLARKAPDDLVSDRSVPAKKMSTFRDVLDLFILKTGTGMDSLTARGTSHLYIVLLLTVYQGVCESCAFVLALDSWSEVGVTGTAASVASFVIIVVTGFIFVWVILLVQVRPQRLALFEAEANKWVATDEHALLLQNIGQLFKSYRFGASRYLFSGVWMLNLLCLAFILAFATGELQLYLMLANEAWIGLLFFVWQPYRLRTPVFGGCAHINKNILHGFERMIMVLVLALAAFYPVDGCSEFPDWLTWLMIGLALLPAVIPLVLLFGSVVVWIYRKCKRKAQKVVPSPSVRGATKSTSPAGHPAKRTQWSDRSRKVLSAMRATQMPKHAGYTAAEAPVPRTELITIPKHESDCKVEEPTALNAIRRKSARRHRGVLKFAVHAVTPVTPGAVSEQIEVTRLDEVPSKARKGPKLSAESTAPKRITSAARMRHVSRRTRKISIRPRRHVPLKRTLTQELANVFKDLDGTGDSNMKSVDDDVRVIPFQRRRTRRRRRRTKEELTSVALGTMDSVEL